MGMFFYVILLILLIFTNKYHFDALIVNSESLSKIPFEIEDSLFHEIKSFPKLRKRNREFDKTSEKFKLKGTESNKITRYFEGFKNPHTTYSAQNSRLYSVPQSEGPEINPENSEPLKTAITSWKDLHEIANYMKDVDKKWRNFLKRKRRKRVLRYLANFEPEKSVKFLDYTNSQMPFNEGNAQYKRFKKKNSEVSDGDLMKGKKSFANSYDRYLESELEPYTIEKSLRKLSDLPLRSQEENFKIFGDDPIMKYSRVRRFLDHERAKKRKRMSNTLEAKEAAMSRVLDPNVNLEGILEPHVRKRRGQNTAKRGLSFNQKYKKKLRSKRQNSNTVTVYFQNENQL